MWSPLTCVFACVCSKHQQSVGHSRSLSLFLFMCVNNVPSFILKLTHSITTFSKFFRNHQICAASLALLLTGSECVMCSPFSALYFNLFSNDTLFSWGWWMVWVGGGSTSLYKCCWCWRFLKPKNLQLDSNAFERSRNVSKVMYVFVSPFYLSTCIHSFGIWIHYALYARCAYNAIFRC